MGVRMKIEVNGGKLPWVVGIGAVAAGILFMILLVLHPNGSGIIRPVGYLMTILIICIGIGMCVSGRNKKMLTEGRTLYYTDSLGRKKTFSLEEIGHCKAALEEKGGRDYLKIYDHHGKKLCNLTFGMKNSALFLQYLLDNQIKIECSDKSDDYLKSMLCTKSISAEEIPENVNACFEETEKIVREWEKEHTEFGVEWKMGIAAYLEAELAEKKQLWEQKGYIETDFPSGLPEGYLIAIEGYLQKGDRFVFDKKNRAVTFYVPVISVSKSMQADGGLKIRFFDNAAEETAWQLNWLANTLPRNRYHMEEISLNHQLRKRL